MQVRHRIVAAASAAALAAGPAALVLAPTASAAAPKPTSLADVLLADTKNGKPSFDKNSKDFDILTAAVLGVLDAKPKSPVSVLTKANVKLTAFIPTDKGFRKTAKALGITEKREANIASAIVSALGVNKVEKVLLYHVVPGAKITAKQAAAADGASLKTALGKSITVNVRHDGSIFLRDANKQVANPKVIVTDINKAPRNAQVAHAINSVLLPF